MHLIILVHGLFGKPSHLQCLHDELCSQLKDQNCVVHLADANSALGTFDGVEACARRSLSELRKLIEAFEKENHSISSISIIGYSLGGLVARFLVGLLEEESFFDSVKPFLFATFATPHLGTVNYHGGFITPLINAIGANLLGPSGRDLFNKSKTLSMLAYPEGLAMKGLKKFPHLYLFANAVNDRTVPFWTSFITDKSPFEMGSVDLVFSYKPIVDLQKSRWSPQKRGNQTKAGHKLLFAVIFCLFGPILLSVMTFGTILAYGKKLLGLVSMDYKREILSEDILAAVTSTVESILDESVVSEPSSDRGRREMGEDFNAVRGFATPKSSETLIDICESTVPVTEDIKLQIEALNKLPWHKFVVFIHRTHSHAEIVNRRGALRGEGKLLLRAFAKQLAMHIADSSSH